MNKSQFRSYSQYVTGKDTNKEYWYFEWKDDSDDIAKYRSFLIGHTHAKDGSTRHPMGHFSHKKQLYEDADGIKIERFFGWSASVNVNIRVFSFYKIGGEEQGQRVTDKLFNSLARRDQDPIYREEDIYLEGNFTSKYLAIDKMIDRFWEDNKDWLKDIQVPELLMVF